MRLTKHCKKIDNICLYDLIINTNSIQVIPVVDIPNGQATDFFTYKQFKTVENYKIEKENIITNL
jgi:hypothetical protein